MTAARSRSAHRRGGLVLLGLLVLATSLLVGLSVSSTARAGTPLFDATQTTLAIGSTSANVGDPITFSVSVRDLAGNAAPLGTVTLSYGTSSVFATLSLQPASGDSSTATATVTTLPAGRLSIVATYTSSNELAWSTSSSPAQTISIGAPLVHNTVTTLTTSPASPVALGQPVTLTAHVAVGDGSGIVPTGTVTFRDNGVGLTPISQPLDANGNATLTVYDFGGGSHTLDALYSGDTLASASASPPVTLQVQSQPATSVVQITAWANPNPAYADEHVTFSAHVVQSGTATPPPAGGVVTFRSDQGTIYGTAIADGNGDASLLYTGGLTPGTVTVTASYDGSQVAGNPGGTPYQFPFTVKPPLDTMSVGLAPGSATSAQQGDRVDLSARLVDLTNPGAGLSGETLTISFGAESCDAVTDDDGIATCQGLYVADPAGSYPVTVAFAGDSDAGFKPASDSSSRFVVLGTGKAQATLAYTGDTSAYTGDTARLSARLTTAAGGLGGETVTFTLGTQSCSGQTDPTGAVSCTIALSQGPGSPGVVARFDGDSSTLAARASAPFSISLRPTAIAYGGATSGVSGDPAPLSATLSSNGQPLAGKPLTLSLGSLSCSATTGANGVAACSVTAALDAGSYPLVASFAGDSSYRAASDASTSFLVSKRPTTLTLGPPAPPTVRFGDPVTLTATLVDQETGQPVPDGKLVTLALGTQSCQSTTRGGLVACRLASVAVLPGSQQLGAAFAGDGVYAASRDSRSLTVEKAPTVAAYTGPTLAATGGSVTLTGSLADGSGNPLAGRALTLALNGRSCTGLTGADGVASCTIAGFDGTNGPGSGSAAFAGDPYYLASTNAKASLVYSFAPGGGQFTLGDRSAAGSVLFWGAQWAKLNSLSGGAAPSQFKGYAANAPRLVCGATWTAAPGESSKPPAGPLPAYLGVLVTSAVGKSGPTLSGTIVGLAVVKTGAGYANDPGHAGTGTVVATIPCSGS
jgi:hypothetical protein